MNKSNKRQTTLQQAGAGALVQGTNSWPLLAAVKMVKVP